MVDINDLIDELTSEDAELEKVASEEEEQEEIEKTASEEEVVNYDLDEFTELVQNRAMEKIAEQLGGVPKAEVSPQEIHEKTKEDLSEEDVDKIANAIVDSEEEGIDEYQQEKIASVAGEFSGKGDSAKAELFTKLASAALANSPKIVVDKNYQTFQTLDGQPNDPDMYNTPGAEIVNTIKDAGGE